ncbi:MAG: TnsA-like heteromeric transposase endonuclease subunit [Solirubrobacteraceae bacterium]
MQISVSLRLADRSTREIPLRDLSSKLAFDAIPWRRVRSYRGQRHMPGLYWSATTGDHVVYESRLELARLLLADIDHEVVDIAAKPFLVREKGRRHIPDFLLGRADGSTVVVNVKPAGGTRTVLVTDTLAWAGRVFASKGWEHELWTGADPQLLANVRFLSGYRRGVLLQPRDIAVGSSLLQREAGMTIGGAEAALRRAGVSQPRPVVLHLLWSGLLRARLDCPLTGGTELEVV